MNWVKRESSFTYSGKPVTRTSYTYTTPFGDIRAFEAVSGKVRYEFPYFYRKEGDYTIGISINKIAGGENQNRFECATLDIALASCEFIWKKFKEELNKY